MPQTLHAAAEAVRQGRSTPLDLLDECLSRIDRYEPQVRAWVFVDRERARAEAEQMTVELRKGDYRGPLHGIPLAIKDIFDVFDWPTAAGSRLWAQSIARRDATVVERLRQAGAVLIGKTVTTQYASFDPPVTRNPWDLGRTPGGSSSGSAAAVACGMCFGALGSQTGGSITRPASYCGVPGFKPTWGRVSTDGVMPLAPSMDHVGPLAPSVRDLAIMLQVFGGPDPRDPACDNRPLPDLLQALPGKGERAARPRLGRVRGLFEELAEPPMRAMMDAVCDTLREAGATLTEVALPAGFSDVIRCHRIVMAVESAAYHRLRLQRHPEDYEPRIRGLLEEGLACPATEYARAKEVQQQLARDMRPCFAGVDGLLMPATTGPAPDAATTGNPAFNSPWSFTGLPTVSFPTGRFADGLPLAVQVVGPAWSEAELLATAAWCEAALAAEPRDPPVHRTK
jgi:aspartyl-tRNA(Asn)/glutamyl-tRNA(Gln) amidotransferase subunit A